MSLAPKIDEIAYTIKTVDADIALFTETWLRDTVPDISININHYQLYRRDCVNRLHGGVCMYVKDSIHCKILADLKREFLQEHESVSQSELNCLLDTVKDETVKVYTKGEWMRKVEKVRIDEKSCRAKHDLMAKEIGSLKRKLLRAKKKIKNKK
jgi:hypothetical protein